ncbi:hypothetical protein CHS0354_017239 [Potamilus streckersoni]|uniref:Integrase catalytic domain-containing protein n=1 Tax=Potamilus streckersoni TaxID=2493646 RepID=A0AAE0RZ02_9BIVA|nr:hypothetical protein CHS0354_017239 [Potamilus streckersoni]
MAARCNMLSVLIKVGLDEFAGNFDKQKVSPDIVCFLSAPEVRQLGLSRKEEMIKLRMECIKYGANRLQMKTIKPGPPEFVIPKCILQNLTDDGFLISDIAKLLSVSESTVYHEKGVEERKNGCLQRRVYNVKGPNHLWHIDTNHTLIRWHMIIAGGIDGFSRLIVYLQCKDNNRAETIFQYFLTAVENFGIPQRVRSDKGLENVSVANYMIQQRGTGRGSMITGKSVHNQRIERLWRDVYLGVLVFYYNLFYFMEDEGILDPLNDIHIAALHSTFLPKINDKLDIWKEAWVRHRMRTVH